MSNLVFLSPDGSEVPAEQALVDALTDPSEKIRVMGRAVATGFPDKFADWANAELRRGTKPHDLLRVILELQVQMFASIAAGVMTASGDEALTKIYSDHVMGRLPPTIAAVRTSYQRQKNKG